MTWVYLLVLGVVATGLSTVAFFYMVFKRGPLFAGMTTYVVPMLALAWGEFDHESISAQQLVAMAGVLVMVGLVQSGTTRPEEEFELQPEATANLVPSPVGLHPEMSRATPVTFASATASETQVTSA
jgi:hypothetical protein